MYKTLTIIGLMLISYALPAMGESVVSADCYYVGSSAFGKGAISTGSATSTDKDFEAQKGIIVLKENSSLDNENILRGDQKVSEWSGTQKINLGHNYNLILQLAYKDSMRMGGHVFGIPSLRGSALLTFNGLAISSGSLTTDRVKNKYIDDVSGTGPKFYEVDFSLDNTALRTKLGATEQPGLELIDIIRKINDKSQLFSSFGDGDGVVTKALINCKIPISK